MLALVPIAVAHSVTIHTIRSWLPELQEAIEADQGRKFAELPRVRIATTAEAERIVRAHGGDDELSDTLAVYLSANQTIYLLDDGIRNLYGSQRVDPDEFTAVTKCMLAHEMIHSLQHQRGPAPPHSPAARAMLEGQAVDGAARVCAHPVASKLVAIALGEDVLASRPPTDEMSFRYGYGAQFVEAARGAYGAEAAWSLLRWPPEREAIIDTVSPLLPAGWTDPAPLRAALDAIGASGEESSGHGSPWETLSILDVGAADSSRLTFGEAGLVVHRVDGDRNTTAVAFRFRDHDEPIEWLRRRRAEFGTSRGVWLPARLHDRRGIAATRPPALEFDETLTISLYHGDGDRYREHWVAHDGVLVCVWATHSPPAPLLTAAVQQIAGHYGALGRARGTADVTAWRSLPPTPSSLSPRYVQDRLRRASAEGSPDDCEAAGRGLIAEVADVDRSFVEEAISACRSPAP